MRLRQKAGRVLAGCLIAGMLCGLTGCYAPFYRGPQYTEEEEKEKCRVGKELLEGHLSEGSEVLSAVSYTIGMSQFLTPYVKGSYRDEDGEWNYIVDTGNREVYSYKYTEELQEESGRYLRELLGFDETWEIETVSLITLSLSNRNYTYDHDCLPIDVTDVRAYLENAKDRDSIYVKLVLVAPDDVPLAGYGLEDVAEGLERSRDAGLSADVVVHNLQESLNFSGQTLVYEKTVYREIDDFLIGGLEETRRETLGGDGVIAKESRKRNFDEITVQKTEEGYGIKIEQDDDWGRYVIHVYAREGSELLQKTCQLKFPEQEMWYALEWSQIRDTGLWVLLRESGEYARFLDGTELLIKKEN